MAFDGNESEAITLEQATAWTNNYRQANPGEVKAHFFGINKIQELLSQDECIGIRAYYAIDNNGNRQLIFVGATEEEKDLYDGIILDKSVPCPSACDSSSPLF
jgi:hypothetical protein